MRLVKKTEKVSLEKGEGGEGEEEVSANRLVEALRFMLRRVLPILKTSKKDLCYTCQKGRCTYD